MADIDFTDALLAAARPDHDWTDPFVESVLSGQLSRDAIRRYATALVAIAGGFPRRIAQILSICDVAAVRALLIANLLEEEGVVGWDASSGLRVDPERRHSTLARRFARAAGASDADIDASIAASRSSRWFESAIERGDWIGAFAYVSVGHEANVPGTFKQLVPPLGDRYGFSLEDLIFLTEHSLADERHGNDAAHLIASVAHTGEARLAALEGARRGGSAWRAWPRTSISSISMTPRTPVPA